LAQRNPHTKPIKKKKQPPTPKKKKKKKTKKKKIPAALALSICVLAYQMTALVRDTNPTQTNPTAKRRRALPRRYQNENGLIPKPRGWSALGVKAREFSKNVTKAFIVAHWGWCFFLGVFFGFIT